MKNLADEALSIVGGDRQKTYGPPERNFGRIAGLWTAYTQARWAESSIAFEPRDVAAFMRLLKEARLCESPDHRDSYVDLIGYALCGADLALSGPAKDTPRASTPAAQDEGAGHQGVAAAPARKGYTSGEAVQSVAPRPGAVPVEEDWIPWSGGECPVHPRQKVFVRVRHGSGSKMAACASDWWWSHRCDGSDIVAYRLAKPLVSKAEPKEKRT